MPAMSSADLDTALQLVFRAWLAKRQENPDPLHPEEMVRPIMKLLGAVMSSVACPQCRAFVMLKLANTMTAEMKLAYVVPGELTEHFVPWDEPAANDLGTMPPAGRA